MPAASPSGRVFISYRRLETGGLAGRLYDRLAAHFGEGQVFMDVDTIALVVDFAEVITEAVSTCDVLLAVIGPTWLIATDENGQRQRPQCAARTLPRRHRPAADSHRADPASTSQLGPNLFRRRETGHTAS